MAHRFVRFAVCNRQFTYWSGVLLFKVHCLTNQCQKIFSLTESYGNISDKLAVAAMKGVQFDQFEEAYKAYKETVTINQNSLMDYLSALITLIKAGEKPQKAGESLAIIMNKLIEMSRKIQ